MVFDPWLYEARSGACRGRGVVMVNRVVVALLIATVSTQVVILLRQRGLASLPPSTRVLVEDIADRALTLSLKDTPTLGAKTSGVAIVEFADFECSFCRKHATTVLPALKEKFVRTGVASYSYFHLPLQIHPHAVEAAKAAECAGDQGRFWDMHDLLFDSTEPAALAAPGLRAAAATLSLDLTAFDDCFATASERVDAQVSEAARLGVEFTPVFMIGRIEQGGIVRLATRINGAQSMDVFAEAIEQVSHSNRSAAVH